jgi:hypothetical protein
LQKEKERDERKQKVQERKQQSEHAKILNIVKVGLIIFLIEIIRLF